MCATKLRINFSATVTNSLKEKLKKDIVNAQQGSPELRAEIRRVFQVANRRIQNIEKAGVYSPAVAALGKNDVTGYSKFSVKGFGNTGNSWNELKKEYAKAISFLSQPTSTATGARAFESSVKSTMGISDDLWKSTREALLNGYNTVSNELLNALPYSDYLQEVYERARDMSNHDIELEALKLADELERAINDNAENVVDDITTAFESLNGFEVRFK